MQLKNRVFYLIIAAMLMVTVSLGSLALIDPANEAQAQNVACYREQGGAKNVAASGCEFEFQSGAILDIQDGVTFNIGTGLYPLKYASANQELVCGTTSTFTGSTTISVSGLTTATYPVAIQVTAPTTTAAYLHVNDPTTSTITLTSLDNTFGAGTTGIVAHYCVVGDE